MSSILVRCILFMASPVASLDCSAGEYKAGDGQCQKCPPGRYQNSQGGVFCNLCPLGRYAGTSGLSECWKCPQPHAMTTWRTGSTRRIECVCEPGHFMVSCDNPSKGCPCQECPEGMSCPGGVSPPCVQRGYMTSPQDSTFHMAKRKFQVKDPKSDVDSEFHQMGCDHWGYNIPEDLRMFVYVCPDPENCPGTCPEEERCLNCWGSQGKRSSCKEHIFITSDLKDGFCPNVAWSRNRDTEIDRCILPTNYSKVCAAGRHSIACASCPKAYFETPDGKCARCGASGFLAMVIMGCLTPLWVIMFYKINNIYNVEAEDDEARRGLLHGCHVPDISGVKALQPVFFFVNYVIRNCTELMIEYLQMLIIIDLCVGLPLTDGTGGAHGTRRGWVAWLGKQRPKSYIAALGAKQGCAISSFGQEMSFDVFAPFFWYLFFFLNHFVSKTCCKKITGVKCGKDLNMTINAIGCFLRTFFPMLAMQGITLFLTFHHPNGKEGLKVHPHIIYGDGEWNQAWLPALFSNIIYFFCIPAVFAKLVHCAPFNYHRRDFRVRYFFFFDGVKPNVYWWRLWKMLRNVFFVMAVIGNDPRQQIMMVQMVMVFSIAVCWKFNGWLTRVQNVLELGGSACVTMVLTATSLRLPPTKDEQADNALTITEVLFLFLPIGLFLGSACIALRKFYRDGPNGSQTESLAQRFRDFLMVANGQRSTIHDIDEFIGNLNDSERSNLEEAIDTFFSEMIALQPSDSFLKRRLICKMPEGADTILYATAETIQKLVNEKQAAMKEHIIPVHMPPLSTHEEPPAPTTIGASEEKAPINL